MGEYADFVYERDRESLRDLITPEMLVGAGFLAKTATKPKASKHSEKRRLEAIETAAQKFLRNIEINSRTLSNLKVAREYAEWFEVFNGERPLANELTVLGADPLSFGYRAQAGYLMWETRARRAALDKSLLGRMLAATTDQRERRIIRVRLATPKWVDYDKIRDVYRLRDEMTAATGIAHHVDHIVPLAGRTAQGLHVHDNMQVLTAAENIRKLNSFNDWLHISSC